MAKTLMEVFGYADKPVVYVAGHDQQECNLVRQSLQSAGYRVRASWLDCSFQRTDCHSEDERRSIAERDVEEVKGCGFLVLLASPEFVPGGKFVEVGVALGLGKPVYVIGRRENMLMWHPGVVSCESTLALLELLARQI